MVLYLALGAYYAGSQFLDNIATAVPMYAAGGEGGLQYMLPGDHFVQLYRYSLPRHNLERDKPLYYDGYQYNLSSDLPAYSEGWIFFPFSLIHAVISSLAGDVTAYNLLALLSFPLVGGAMYWLVFSLTRSHPAALLSSLLLALLPHRTSFLFGEMLYGVDLMWPPLIVLAYEKAIRTLQSRYAVLFGIASLLYATSNIQGFYLFSLFSIPYFCYRAYQTAVASQTSVGEKARQAAVIFVSMLPTLVYLICLRQLIGDSGLSGGQSYAETTFHSPTLINALKVWSGNEKTVYLGWSLFLAATLSLICCVVGYFRDAVTKLSAPDRSVFLFSALIFVVSYLFCFGPNLDTILNVNVYRWYFDHVPGANGTRTPGRLMNTSGFYFALYFGYLASLTASKFRDRELYRRMIWPITLIVAFAVIHNFHYTNPLLVKLETQNSAYESIRGTPGIVYVVPTQVEASHYFNGTFLYYAQKYNLRIFSGHSSLYPREWDKVIGQFLPINEGRFDRSMMERFKARGITHLVAHATTFEPNVSQIVLVRLEKSPYLKKLAEDKGVTVFSVDYNASGEQIIDPGKLVYEIRLRPEDLGKFIHLNGWYIREVYPNHRPFRWMQGMESNGVIFAGDKGLVVAEFAYWCPLEGLTVTVNGRKVTTESADLERGWKRMVINLPAYDKKYYLLQFHTPRVFKAPPDTRDFGCEIGDIEIR